MKSSNFQIFGNWLINLGVAGLILAVILGFTGYSGTDNGSIPAVSIVFIIIGMCFYFPTLLEDNQGGISTMRVMVLAVVLVFVLIYVKIGWNAGTFDEFTIDQTWIYILGLAFGSKAIQRFSESSDEEEEKPKK